MNFGFLILIYSGRFSGMETYHTPMRTPVSRRKEALTKEEASPVSLTSSPAATGVTNGLNDSVTSSNSVSSLTTMETPGSKILASNFEAISTRMIKLRDDLRDEKDRSEQLRGEVDMLKQALSESRGEFRTHMEQCEKKTKEADSQKNEIRKSLDVAIRRSESQSSMSKYRNEFRSMVIAVQQEMPIAQFGDIQQRVGMLTATNVHLQDKMKEMVEEKEDLSRQLALARSDYDQSRSEFTDLQKRMIEGEGTAETTHKYLLEENNKIKMDKASIRCELMQLKRDHERLQREMTLGKQSEKELDEVEEKLRKAERRVNELEKHLEELTINLEQEKAAKGKLDEQMASLRSQLEDHNSLRLERDELKKQLADSIARCKKLSSALSVLDQDNGDLFEQKKRLEASKARVQLKLNEVSEKLRVCEEAAAERRGTEQERDALRAEKDRMESKIEYLTEELRETHSDYKEELARLARQISESRHRDTENEAVERELEQLKQRLAKEECESRSMKRRLDEVKRDNEKLSEQFTDVTQREKSVVDENAKLRKGLVDAVAKIEKYKGDCESAKELSQNMADDMIKAQQKVDSLEEDILALKEELQERERLIGYLQGQTNAKSMPKMERRATLLGHPSTSSLEAVDPSDIVELENQRRELKEKLQMKKQAVADLREHKQPPVRTPLSVTQATQSSSSASSMGSTTMGPPALPSHAKAATMPASIGTMRHDIPHRWKTQLGFGLRQIKCNVCFEGIPRVRQVQRCLECGVTVHSHCASKVVKNTCGLPEEVARFYQGTTYQTANSTMNGWIKVYRDEDDRGKWLNAWASCDGRTLKFYDRDGLADDNMRPWCELELERDAWNIRAGVQGPGADHLENCIHLRLNGRNIYILAATTAAVGRWMECLKAAAGRRMFLTRRPSSFTANSLLIALDAPQNITVNCTYVLEDWLLIGAQEGLFVTSVSQPRVPVLVSGVTSVHALEGLADVGLLAAVCGSNRQLTLLSLQQLRAELPGRQPIARPSVIPDQRDVHLLMYHIYDQQRFLCTATSSSISVLQYSAKRDSFTQYDEINTAEPVTCLLSAFDGFYFGADTFYHVKMFPKKEVRQLVAPHEADYPIAVLPIGDDEVLLAYENHGMFVNSRGTRTRTDLIEWEQMPMEFVYTAPYLYVVHCNALEIMQVAEYTGPTSKTIMDEREVYNCQNAHLAGTKVGGDVYVALSSSDRMELHTFNAIVQKRGSSLKRKGLSSVFSSSTLDKRSKTAL